MLATKSSAGHLLQQITTARNQSDALFRVVRENSLYERPIPERHRIIFYVGHLEAFDWNLLHEVLGLKAFHADFDRLFAFGIDPVGGGLPTDQPRDWPSLNLVHEYVSGIREKLDSILSDHATDSDSFVRDGFELPTLLNVAIEHRLMHLETLAYMFHQLPLNHKIPQVNPDNFLNASVQDSMLVVPAGEVTLGLSRHTEDFGWDNEYERHVVQVPAFEIDKYMVTNRQYLDFIRAGGYENPEFWTEQDWEWTRENAISYPTFWKKSGDDWSYRSMFQEVPLPLDWPVYASHAEASAYARWAGKFLPTETEWQRAAYCAPDGTQAKYPWGNSAGISERGNFNSYRWDPAPVNAFPGNVSAFGVEGMLGNGWEWTSTPFGPYSGFQAFPFYRGYSADFFDGKHFVIKGGSARTASCMLRATFRNWFQSHYQYVYSGFRCVSR